MKEVTLEIRSESLAKFGGAPDTELYRIFLKFDDSEVEIHKTTDCPRHYVTRNHDAHYCLATEKEIHKLPSPPKCLLMCTEVCPYKKQILKAKDTLDSIRHKKFKGLSSLKELTQNASILQAERAKIEFLYNRLVYEFEANVA